MWRRKTILGLGIPILALSAIIIVTTRLSVDPEKKQIEHQTARLLMTKSGDRYVGPSLQTQQEVKDILFAIARRSSSARSKVIAALTESFESGVAKKEFSACNAAAFLLGDLRAEEVTDLLIRNINYNDGTAGLSLSIFPAAYALRQIGNPGVSKLIDALRDQESQRSPDDNMRRRNLAIVLGEIGGTAAEKALSEIDLEAETDPSVLFYAKRARERIGAQPR
jgi:hypothetical protein